MLAATSKAIQGYATYLGERVTIIDVIGRSNGKVEYMINYNGPIWVSKSDLAFISWIVE